jgi:CheY-like chemotaxis protein
MPALLPIGFQIPVEKLALRAGPPFPLQNTDAVGNRAALRPVTSPHSVTPKGDARNRFDCQVFKSPTDETGIAARRSIGGDGVLELNTVLVVDDSKVMRELLSVFLAPHSHRISTAACCEEALAELRADPAIDLVLCEVALPDGDGFEVLEQVVSSGDPEPKVIMMAAIPKGADAERARQLGAIAYLEKLTGGRLGADPR